MTSYKGSTISQFDYEKCNNHEVICIVKLRDQGQTEDTCINTGKLHIYNFQRVQFHFSLSSKKLMIS